MMMRCCLLLLPLLFTVPAFGMDVTTYTIKRFDATCQSSDLLGQDMDPTSRKRDQCRDECGKDPCCSHYVWYDPEDNPNQPNAGWSAACSWFGGDCKCGSMVGVEEASHSVIYQLDRGPAPNCGNESSGGGEGKKGGNGEADDESPCKDCAGHGGSCNGGAFTWVYIVLGVVGTLFMTLGLTLHCIHKKKKKEAETSAKRRSSHIPSVEFGKMESVDLDIDPIELFIDPRLASATAPPPPSYEEHSLLVVPMPNNPQPS